MCYNPLQNIVPEGVTMDFNEKLQQLRKQKGLTQEELAQALYVSRTAISKWESGRGYPNIDSLKAIAKFFSVTVDQLLSGDELLDLAQAENKRVKNRIRDLISGLLDLSVAILFFLPLFAQKAAGNIEEVSLLTLSGIAPYLKVSYCIVLSLICLWGILILALQNREHTFWMGCKWKLSLALTAIGALLFMISLQPYPAALLFIFLSIKALMLIKWQ